MTSVLHKSIILLSFPILTACATRFAHENRGTLRTVVKKDAPALIKPQRVETPPPAKQEESKPMISFEVYRRGGRYFVTAAISAPDILWVTIPDVVPVEPIAESIGAAFRRLEMPIREALAQVQRGERHPEEENEENEEKQWRQMGAKSYRQLLRSASYCSVWRMEDHTRITFMKLSPEEGIFTGSLEPNAKLPPDASYEDIARAVLEVFAKNPPPPDDKPDPPPRRPRKSASVKQ